jgi:phenol 2-monooxygenase
MKPKVSVVIVGAGPVGLLLAYQLSRFGITDYIIVDKRDNNTEIYGRACSIWPRTIELWDQLDLMEDMFAAGGVTTSTGFNFEE